MISIYEGVIGKRLFWMTMRDLNCTYLQRERERERERELRKLLSEQDKQYPIRSVEKL